MKTITRFLISAATLATLSLAAPLSAQAPTWVILVRHAEKADAPAADPPLTAAGQARAKALAARLEYTKLDAVITTQFERTRATGAPTAEAHRITPSIVATSGGNHVQAVVDEIRKHAGGVVLVVGHSNTVPAIVAALGAPAPRPICDSEYDNLYIVELQGTASPTALRTQFGAPSPADSACASMR